MSRTFLIGEKLKEYQSFETIEEMDKSRQKIYYRYKDKFTGAALKVWNFISQNSCTVPGVSYLRIETIQKYINVSRSSIERAIRLFKSLQIIKVIKTERPVKGGQGANIYVIKPFKEPIKQQNEGALMKGRENAETPQHDRVQGDNFQEETINSFKTNNTYNNQLNVKPSVVHAKFAQSKIIKYVPKQLQHFRKVFGDNLKGLWIRICRAIKQSKVNINKHSRIGLGMTVLTKVVEYYRNGQVRTEEEQIRLAYRIAENQIKQRYNPGITEQPNSHTSKSNRTVIRREMTPKWLKERNKGNSTVDSVKAISDPVETSKEESKATFEALIKKFKEGTV